MKLRALVAAFAANLVLTSFAVAQDYPAKAVRIVVPYQAGQGTDVATRFLAEHLTHRTGQSFYVENRPGAGGNIGAAEAARAKPDGYTLMMGTNAINVLNQYMYRSMPFDPAKDFAPVMLVSSFPMTIITTPASPYKSLVDLLEAARAKPDSINVALPSTTARLVLELLNQQSGAVVRGVPYKGSGSSMVDLIGGQVPVAIDTISAARSHIEAGRIKPLAVTSLKPTALLPGIAPVAAQGVKDFQVLAWNALYAPSGTPAAVLDKLQAELTDILNDPAVRKRLLELGHEPAGGSAADLAEFARTERLKWAPLIEKAGLRVD